MTFIVDGTNGLTFNNSTTQASAGLTSSSTQVCQAWVNFNGISSTTIRASYNVSSVTYTGTGLYTVNFTNALSDANYAVTTGVSPRYAAGSAFANLFSNSATTEVAPTTTAFTLRCGATDSGVTADLKYICVAVFR